MDRALNQFGEQFRWADSLVSCGRKADSCIKVFSCKNSRIRVDGVLGLFLHGGGRPQVGEVTRLGGVPHLSIWSLKWSPYLSCKRDQIKMRDCTDRRVTPPKRVTSPTWGPPPPCKQALSLGVDICTAFCNGICDRLIIFSLYTVTRTNRLYMYFQDSLMFVFSTYHLLKQRQSQRWGQFKLMF